MCAGCICKECVFLLLWKWLGRKGLIYSLMMAGRILMVCLQTPLTRKRCVDFYSCELVNLAFGRHPSWKFKFCFWHAASWLSWCDRASHGLCHCEEEVGKWILYYLRTIWGMQTWYTYDAQTWELRLKMWVVSKTQPNVVSTEHVKKTIVNG